MKRWKKLIGILIFIFPFLLGVIGYYTLDAQNLSDSLYNAMELYFLNFSEPETMNPCISAARWLAPLMTASGLIVVLKGLLSALRNFCISFFFHNATAVYCDGPEGKIALKNMAHSIPAENGIRKDVRDHVLMLSDDLDNLELARRIEEQLPEKNIYVKLEQVDSFLMKKSPLHYFNLNEITARLYWRENHLLDLMTEEGLCAKIALIGFGPLGQKLLSYGLMNNIYSPDQQIAYHIWGDSGLYEQLFPPFDKMNRDSVTFHGSGWEQDLELLMQMDRILLTEEADLSLIQALLYRCPVVRIDYYSRSGALLEPVFARDRLKAYGSLQEILTEDNIKKDELYELAQRLNFHYECLYNGMDETSPDSRAKSRECWQQLSGFLKGSNIAAADYHEIRRLLLRAAGPQSAYEVNQDDWLVIAEHIRWCRFYYLNHWTYGQPKDKKERDEKRIHSCLVPYEALSREDKDKDLEMVRLLLELKPV